MADTIPKGRKVNCRHGCRVGNPASDTKKEGRKMMVDRSTAPLEMFGEPDDTECLHGIPTGMGVECWECRYDQLKIDYDALEQECGELAERLQKLAAEIAAPSIKDLDTLYRIRKAIGDNGKMMHDELVDKIKEIVADNALLRKRLEVIKDDYLADKIAVDCHDKYHDDRWCPTCNARDVGIMEDQQLVWIKDPKTAWEWAMGWVEEAKSGSHSPVRRIHEAASNFKDRFWTNGLWRAGAEVVYDYLREAADMAQANYEDAQPGME